MPTSTIIIITTLLVIAITLIPVYVMSRREKVSADSWAVANRSLPIYVVIGTQFASVIGGGTMVGHVGRTYASTGTAEIIYLTLMCSPLLIIMILAKWLRKNNFTTVPEILGKFTENNKVIRVISGIMTLIVPFGWITSQITAFGNMYTAMTGIDYTLLCVVFAIVSLLFILPAGLKTVAWTDFIFGCFMLVMFFIVGFFALNMAGGVEGFTANVDPDLMSFEASVERVGLSTILLWVFSVLPGGLTNQLYFQRVCAIKSEKEVNRSLVISFVVCMVAVLWAIYMGLVINSINPDIAAEGEVTGWFMTQLPVPLMALFAALIFSAIMSTLDSAVQSVVVNITRDILPVFKPDITPEKELRLSRIFSVVVITVALLMCLVFTDTLQWLIATCAFSAAGLACPIYIGYILRKKNFVTTAGIAASMVAGVIGTGIAMILETAVNYAAIGIGVSLVALLIASALTSNKSDGRQTTAQE